MKILRTSSSTKVDFGQVSKEMGFEEKTNKRFTVLSDLGNFDSGKWADRLKPNRNKRKDRSRKRGQQITGCSQFVEDSAQLKPNGNIEPRFCWGAVEIQRRLVWSFEFLNYT